jgi:hypothetical protein
MKKQILSMATISLIAGTFTSASASEASSISLVDNLKVKGEIRTRYEMVDTDNTTSNANALTNRLVLGVGADLFDTDFVSGYVEMTDVHNANDNYNSTANGVAANVVADPEQTRLTQSYIDLKYGDTLLRVGRQMVNLDNQRFIGAVGWRQMPQTFNAYTLVNSSVENLTLTGAYVTQVNKIFAEDSAAGDSASTETVLLNANYKVSKELTATVYGYFVEDFGNTYGLSLTGKTALNDIKLNYRAEYATLTDATFESTSTDVKNDASYYNLELGMNMNGILASLNYEFQSGKSTTDASTEGKTFSTPLGTNHKFNGWADQFLSTPTQGLIDMNLMVGYKSADLGVFKAIYHDFSSDKDSINYGTELDLLYTRAIPVVKGLTGLIKYADYNADDSAASGNPKATDTQKLWVMLDYKFKN